MQARGDGVQPADDVVAVASPPARVATVERAKRARIDKPAVRRPTKHVTERSGILRRIRSMFALIVLTAFTGAALAAVLVAVTAVVVLALRNVGG